MTREQALTTLREYKRVSEIRDEAIRTLAHDAIYPMPTTHIARESGLSRDGIRKILDRGPTTDTSEATR